MHQIYFFLQRDQTNLFCREVVVWLHTLKGSGNNVIKPPCPLLCGICSFSYGMHSQIKVGHFKTSVNTKIMLVVNRIVVFYVRKWRSGDEKHYATSKISARFK